MIDCGLGPVIVKKRLDAVGLKPEQIKAVIVTHTHGDHISNPAFRKLSVPVWCHESHREAIEVDTHLYENQFEPVPGFVVTPFHIFHDSPYTHAFRVDVGGVSIGHIADTGSWTRSMARKLAGVDILGVECNHDIDMQVRSDRPQSLIDRVLSEYGHLSNEQCLAFLSQIIEYGKKPQHTVLLHMSHHCNTPEIAKRVLKGVVEPVVATAEEPTVWFEV